MVYLLFGPTGADQTREGRRKGAAAEAAMVLRMLRRDGLMGNLGVGGKGEAVRTKYFLDHPEKTQEKLDHSAAGGSDEFDGDDHEVGMPHAVLHVKPWLFARSVLLHLAGLRGMILQGLSLPEAASRGLTKVKPYRTLNALPGGP